MLPAMAPRARPRSAERAEPSKLAKASLPVVYEKSGRWWVAEFPSFPGAYSQGRTKPEAYRNLLSAMRDLLDAYAEQIPQKSEHLGLR